MIIGDRVIMNGELVEPAAVRFDLDNLDIAYGYGCYETLKVRDGLLYFPEFHEERLLSSAAILGIQHKVRPGQVVDSLSALVAATGAHDNNLRVVMIGHDDRPADWYAFVQPPILPAAELYRDGVDCLLFRGERHFPQAKSLSMLLSTIAYRAAQSLGCYDAILVNGRGELTEGTRTNLLYVRRDEAGVAFTPPRRDVLEGITRRTIIQALGDAGLRTVERVLTLAEATDGSCEIAVTSTSSRILPVRRLAGLSGAGVAEPSVAIGATNHQVTGEDPVPALSRAPLVPVDAARFDAAAIRHHASGAPSGILRLADIYSHWLEQYREENRCIQS